MNNMLNTMPAYQNMPNMPNIMPNYQNMWPNQQYLPMMKYQNEALEDMYPEIYYRVFPRVQRICEMMDMPSNPEMHPYPSRAAVERMTDNIFREVAAEMQYTDEDWDSYVMEGSRQISPYFGGIGPGYGFGRRFLRDLIGILLIRQLLSRRGIFYY
ncbi:MAG: hypothetical protein ACOX7R_06135 [Acetivibrionales bacterium]|jgi:hypothetical protein